MSVYDYTDENGKDHFKSFTDPDPNQVLLAVAQFKADKAAHRRESATPTVDRLTLANAMDRVLESKAAVWSPTTYRSNRSIRRNNLQSIMSVRLCDLTQEMVQAAINQEALTHSPKTLRNMHGFLASVLRIYRPEFTLVTTLPQRVKSRISIPNEQEIRVLMDASRGTFMELPIILAAFCGMRRSEIAALTLDCVDFDKRTLTIRSATVRGVDTTWTIKTTKTTDSTRTIRLFPQAYEAIKRLSADMPPRAPLVTLSPNKITERFTRLCQLGEIPHYRFHDLRHFCVSAMLGQGIPKKYIADYVGHNSENMIDQVYAHIMSSVKTAAEDKMEAYFATILQ